MLDHQAVFRTVARWLVLRVHHPAALLMVVVFASGMLSALFVNDTICLVFTPILIEVAEARKAEIHTAWCQPDYYEKTPPARIAAIEAEEKALGPKIEALMAEWEAIERELSAK